MKLKLARALKEKNRLVGEINRIKALINRENSRNVTSSSKVDCAKLWTELEDVSDKLVVLKTAIFKANAGIYGKIVLLGELKDMVTWIEDIPTTNGIFEKDTYGGVTRKEEFTAFVKQEDIDGKTVEMQKLIATTQDEVDEYNAKTEIDI